MANTNFDQFEAYYREKIWAMIPEVYRNLDEDGPNGRVLFHLVTAIAVHAAKTRRSIDRLWEDQHIETCEDWAVPYIAELVGTRLLPALDQRLRRVDVARTMHYRRRRGTKGLLESIATELTDWDVVLVEGFTRLARAAHRLDRFPVALGKTTGTPQAGFADLRSSRVSALAGTPFDELYYSPDVRVLRGYRGQHNIKKLNFHIFPMRAYPVEQVTPSALRDPGPPVWTVDPSGRDIPLYTPGQRISDSTLGNCGAPWDALPAPDAAKNSETDCDARCVTLKEWQVRQPIPCGMMNDARFRLTTEALAKVTGITQTQRDALAPLLGYTFNNEARLRRRLTAVGIAFSPAQPSWYRDLLREAVTSDSAKALLFPTDETALVDTTPVAGMALTAEAEAEATAPTPSRYGVDLSFGGEAGTQRFDTAAGGDLTSRQAIPGTSDVGVSMLIDSAMGRFTYPSDGRPVTTVPDDDDDDDDDPPGDGGPAIGTVGLFSFTGPLNVADRVHVLGACVNASGTGNATDIGVDARVGNVYSIPSVNLRGRNNTGIHTVSGFVKTGGAIYTQNNADITDLTNTVIGTPPDLSAILAALNFTVTFPANTVSGFTVGMGETRNLTPGLTMVGDVDIHGTLVLTSGDYYLESLTLQSQGTLTVNATSGKVRVFLRGDLTLRGSLGPANLNAANFELIVEGASAIIDKPAGFTGIVIARQAALSMSQCTQLTGAFFGRTVQTQPDQTYTLVGWSGIGNASATIATTTALEVATLVATAIATQAESTVPTTSPSNVTTWRIPDAVRLADLVALAGAGDLVLDASSTLGLGGYAPVANVGSGTTTLGAGARTGNVYSVGNVTIKAGAIVTGNVYSRGTITVETGAVVTGSQNPNHALPLKTVTLAPPAAGTVGSAVTVAAGERVRLTAGNYGAVTVAKDGILELVGDAFQMASLNLVQGGSLLIELPKTGGTLRVAGNVTLSGSLGALAGSLEALSVFTLTESNVEVSGSFSGQIVAPNARIVAGSDGQRGYLGRLIASEIYLQNGVALSVPPENPVVHLYHFGFPGDVGAGTLPLREVDEDGSDGPRVINELPANLDLGSYVFEDSLTYRWALDGSFTINNVDWPSDVEEPLFTGTQLRTFHRGRPYVLIEGTATALPRLLPNPTVPSNLRLEGLWLGSFNAVDGRLVIAERGTQPTVRVADWGTITLDHCTLDPGGVRADGDPIASLVLVIRGHVEHLVIDHSIVGAIVVDETVPGARVDQITITNSVVDGRLHVVGGRRSALFAPLAEVTLSGVTVIGDLLAEKLTAKSTIVTGALQVANTQNSCFSHSAAALSEPTALQRNLPKLFEVPRLAHVYDSYFSSLRFGDPTYCQLSAVAPDALKQGGEGGTEMGVFSYLNRPLRLAAVSTKLDEFAPVGVLPQFVFQEPVL